MGWVKDKGGSAVKKFEEGGKVKTNRGEGDKYKTIYTVHGPPGGRLILVEEDLDKKERRAANAKRRKKVLAERAKREAEERAKREALMPGPD